MRITRVAFGVAYLYVSLAVCVVGRTFSETSPDGSPDTAIALEEKHALAGGSRISWSFTPSELQEQQRVPVVHFRTPKAVSQERRSLRDVYNSPDTIGNPGGGGGLSTAGIVIIIIVSSVALVLFVAVLVFCCCRKRSNVTVEWRLLSSFKSRSPETDDEKLHAQATSDTHLSGY
jgi:hypothetical protein